MEKNMTIAEEYLKKLQDFQRLSAACLYGRTL